MIATCPTCGTVEAVYIRSDFHKDLVCQSCRDGSTLGTVAPNGALNDGRAGSAPTTPAPPSSYRRIP
jgi:hypothetical protein